MTDEFINHDLHYPTVENMDRKDSEAYEIAAELQMQPKLESSILSQTQRTKASQQGSQSQAVFTVGQESLTLSLSKNSMTFKSSLERIKKVTAI